MKIRFETVSPAPLGGAINMSVELDVPDGAATSEVEAATRAACDAHYEMTETQRAWAEEMILAHPELASPQPQPRPTSPRGGARRRR